MAHIKIPPPLRNLTEQCGEIKIEAADIQVALQRLVERYPLLKPYLFDEQNTLCHYLSIYLNNTQDIRYLKENNASLSPSDTLTIVVAVAGG